MRSINMVSTDTLHKYYLNGCGGLYIRQAGSKSQDYTYAGEMSEKEIRKGLEEETLWVLFLWGETPAKINLTKEIEKGVKVGL